MGSGESMPVPLSLWRLRRNSKVGRRRRYHLSPWARYHRDRYSGTDTLRSGCLGARQLLGFFPTFRFGICDHSQTTETATLGPPQERGYLCPFCPTRLEGYADPYKALSLDRWYPSADHLNRHVAGYHYPFIELLLCWRCRTLSAAARRFVDLADLEAHRSAGPLRDCAMHRQ